MANGSDIVVLTRPDLQPGREAPQGVRAAAHLLERLLWPLYAPSAEEGARRLLEFALDECRQPHGVVGVFDPMGRFRMLAACNRASDQEPVIPQAVLDEARAAPAPFFSPATDDPLGEWMIAPLGPERIGVLAMGGAVPEEPAERQSHLRLAQLVGELIHSRVTALRNREDMREEIRRLRFQRTPALATILCSTRLSPLLQPLKEAGRHCRPVLIIGEDGTEKEDLAHYLHAKSETGSGPFVPFHPFGLPPHRVEEALFGTPESGGALHRARGGTLYIEGPESLPMHVQTRMLGALLDDSYERGDGIVPLDVRIIAAIGERSDDGLVAELAEALADTEIRVPPLRGHCEDISALTELVLSEMGPGPDGRPRELSPQAKRRLLDYRWDGNLRELRTVLEGAAARSGPQPIAERHLPAELRTLEAADESGLAKLMDVEQQHILRVLHAVGGRRAKAAKVLGIATSTLYEKLKRFGLES